ncbi:MAG: hypothetical protein M1331_01890 [Candidatus Marsarchaeota archaeon]|nr:hypothetical protein [Candidatus Marsarchaeota archaeon]MCL5106127.1 hypothetical protein [Candidatus Marsarchaeota archaeon]
MAIIKIYSPPIITAKEKVVLGHGANLVWCDVLSRSLIQKGLSVNYNFPSWNHQGKMFNYLAETDNLIEILHKKECSLQSKLSLFGLREGYNIYRDTDQDSKKNAQDKFKKLVSRGFISKYNDKYLLRIDLIKTHTDLINHIKSAKFFPKGSKERVLDLVRTLDGGYPITKPREFATTIPGDELSAFRINPIFDIAVSPLMFSEKSVDYSIDGLKTMLHGTFIPFVIYSGLYDIPFSKNVAVHGYLRTDPLSDAINLEDFHRKTSSDVLRGSSLLCVNSMEDTLLDQSQIKKIIKGTSKLIKLAWFFKRFNPPPILQGFQSALVETDILNMHQSSAINRILEQIYHLSRRLEKNQLEDNDYTNYISVLNDSQVFFPHTFEKAVKILMRRT